jgi:cytochrome c nitrite reductase small subunit
MLRRHIGKLIAILIGVPLGVGVFTFHYAGGTSYLSKDPAACANCHIMNSQYDSWQKASHHGVATCVDCHLPTDLVGKYEAKLVNGYNHSKAFTFQDFSEPIMITERNAEILQDNCLRCHGDLLHETTLAAAKDPKGMRCVHCHRTVGHGQTLGLGGPDRGVAAERK